MIQSFEGNVKASEHIAKLKNAILSDEKVAEQAKKEISAIQKKIENGELAKKVSESIDKRDLLKPFKEKMQKMVGDVNSKLTKFITDSPEKVDKKGASAVLDPIEKEVKQLISTLYSDCGRICEETLKNEIEELISDYKESLRNFGEDTSVGGVALDLSIFANFNTANTFVIYDKYVEKEQKKEGKTLIGKIVGGLGGAIAGFFIGGPFGAVIGGVSGTGAGSFFDKDKHTTKEIVKLRALVKDSIEPLQENILTAINDITKQVEKQVGAVKAGLKQEFERINKKILEEIESLNKTESNRDDILSAIEQYKVKIDWIKSIQARVTSISEKIWTQNS